MDRRKVPRVNLDSNKSAHPTVRPLMDAIDTIRLRRITALQAGGLDTQAFRVENIHHNWLPGFNDMKVGRRRYLPSRDEILNLAVQMGCSLEETNTLLLSVNFRPAEERLTGAALEEATTARRQVMAFLPIAAYLINRDWNVLEITDAFHLLFQTDRTDEARASRAGHLNLLHLLFDPRYPWYHRVNPTGRDDDPQWLALCAVQIRSFKLQNLLCSEHDWYRDLRDSLAAEFPVFRSLWDRIQIDSPIGPSASMLRTYTLFCPLGGDEAPEPIIMAPIHIKHGDAEYPQIIGAVPIDEAAFRYYRRVGLPLPVHHLRN